MVASNKETSVWNQGKWVSGNLEWLTGWCIDMNSSEFCAEEKKLTTLLCDIKPALNKHDIVMWPYGAYNSFIVRSCYEKLLEGQEHEAHNLWFKQAIKVL